MRVTVSLLLAGSALALGGCVAGIAAGAMGAAVRGVRGEPENNEHLQPAAADACRARASTYGTVHIIDQQQTSRSKIVVWGTVEDGREKRSFQCAFGTKITGFKLRAIKPGKRD